MKRDLTLDQLAKRLEANGIRFERGIVFLDKPADYIASFGTTLISTHHLGSVRFWQSRRKLLAYAIREAGERRQLWAARLARKAAWDAEFSQPIEPNFVLEREALLRSSVIS